MEKENKENPLARELTEQFTRQTGMLLEQIRSEVRTVAEGHGQITRQIEELKENMDQGFNAVDQRFNGVQVEIQAMAKGLKAVEGEVREVKKELREFKDEMHEFKKETGQQFERVEGTLGSVLRDHEKRITKVEEKLAV